MSLLLLPIIPAVIASMVGILRAANRLCGLAAWWVVPAWVGVVFPVSYGGVFLCVVLASEAFAGVGV